MLCHVNSERIFAYIKALDPLTAGPVVDLANENELLVQRFVGRLIVTLAYDNGDAFTLLQRRHLDQLAMSESEAFELGRRNLSGLVEAGQVRLHASDGGFAVIAGGNFEASTLLVPSVWHWTCDHVGATRLLAAAPARDLLFVVNPDDVDGCAQVDAFLGRLRDVQLDHALTPDRYLWEGGLWRVTSATGPIPAAEAHI